MNQKRHLVRPTFHYFWSVVMAMLPAVSALAQEQTCSIQIDHSVCAMDLEIEDSSLSMGDDGTLTGDVYLGELRPPGNREQLERWAENITGALDWTVTDTCEQSNEVIFVCR